MILALNAPAVAAEVPNIPVPEHAVDRDARHRVLVRGLNLSGTKIEFETTRLSDFQKRFPQLKIQTQGDAATSETWVCLTLDAGQGSVEVWLNSGEVAGGDVVDGVYAPSG